MRQVATRVRAAMVTCVLSAGCSGTPTEPTIGVTGAWRGTITRGATVGTAILQLTQSGPGVTGTWVADLEGTAFDQSGTVGGTVTASTASLFLRPGSPTVCDSGQTFSGTLTMNGSLTADRLTGDYLVLTCDAPATGRIEVNRESP